MTKLYIFPDDGYESKPARGDTIAGRFYCNIQDLLDDECLNDVSEDSETYSVIVIDTEDFKEITIHRGPITVTEKTLYPTKKAKKGGK
jgi:hypothetical protein